MYQVFLHIHTTLRWLILLSMVTTLIKYIIGWFGGQPWKKIDNLLGIVFTSLMDLQLLTGLTLYFFLSPITKMAFSDFGAAMKNDNLRFFAVEHLSVMLIAVVLVHIGRAKSKKAKTDIDKFRTATYFFLIALVIIVATIPWSRL
jgi:membrane protein DedA with SNARE-associated domain